MALQKTQRTFKDIEDNENFNLYIDNEKHNYALISEGSEKYANGTSVNGFYICAHTSVDIKINNSKVINLPTGYFYNIKEGERITHKKFCGFKKFTKEKN